MNVTLENCEMREISLVNLPQVLDGAGFGIVEDVGGVGWLGKHTKALKKSTGRKYDDFCTWLDFKAFGVDDVNFRVKKLFRVYKELYEYHYELTNKILGVLLQAYQSKGSWKYWYGG